MANSIPTLPELSGAPAEDDLFHVVDVSEPDPQDRRAAFAALHSALDRPRFVLARAPGGGDDVTEGVLVGNRWLDTTGPALYMCTDATEAAAVWRTVADWS